MVSKRDSVGWRLYSNWQQYSDLTFSPSAPVGHLPAAPFFTSSGMGVGWNCSLKPKLVDCYAENF